MLWHEYFPAMYPKTFASSHIDWTAIETQQRTPIRHEMLVSPMSKLIIDYQFKRRFWLKPSVWIMASASYIIRLNVKRVWLFPPSLFFFFFTTIIIINFFFFVVVVVVVLFCFYVFSFLSFFVVIFFFLLLLSFFVFSFPSTFSSSSSP